MDERVVVEWGKLRRVAAGPIVAVNGPGAGRLLEAVATGRAALFREGRRVPGPFGWCPADLRVFPHLSVRENLGYAGARRAEVGALATRLGLQEWLDRRPRSVPRVSIEAIALGRAILTSPLVWLLDLPALDSETVRLVREEQARTGAIVLGSGFPGADSLWEV